MDKSWMNLSRGTIEYREGVDNFINFAFSKVAQSGRVLCPCKKCCNNYWKNLDIVKDHLLESGFIKGYNHWFLHGESIPNTSSQESENDIDLDPHDDMINMLHEVYPNCVAGEGTNEEAEKFYKLVGDAQQELYPGCKKFTKLSFIVKLYHLKCINGWTNKSFSMLLELLAEAFPEGHTLPSSFYETKKIIGDLGLSYKKIHACPNDCMLYWKEFENVSSCPKCGVSRWKIMERNSNDNSDGAIDEKVESANKRKIPAKILRYFPLKSRLQRLFMSSETASLMRWHHEGRTKDGLMRHPADSPAWKNFDHLHKDFSSEPRNVRLGLASDGFNPFRTMSISHSTWPVVLIPYNLPPWLCMKQPYFILSLLIEGPRAPGNNIDIYLQPLIEELNELWMDGIDTYDASCNQTFRMHAALLWTISDFPGYAILSGWSTKGRLACPSCNKNTCSLYLRHSHKFCYMGHRRFLDLSHKFRQDKNSFDGTIERRDAPITLSGCDLLAQLKDVSSFIDDLNNDKSRNKRKKEDHVYNWKKRSIFFTLPYWKTLLIRHNLDVMHIEKNLCDNVLYTLLNTDGKTKDGMKARLDLRELCLRGELHPEQHGNKTYLPPACFYLAAKEKEILCKVLKNVKMPDGFAANIRRRVNLKERKISGLKSHDSHILMQQLLPLAIRKILPKNVAGPLIALSSFFKELCSKVLQGKDMQKLESQIALTLCQLERIFPPTFFDIMVHLPIHLASEAKIAGPVQYRWMYPIERFLFTLKSYVRNKSCPEGSIAEGYLAEECLIFCSRYLKDVETKLNRPVRNYDGGVIMQKGLSFSGKIGRAVGHGEVVKMEQSMLNQAHRYVLFNHESIQLYKEKHLDVIKIQHPRARQREIERIHNTTFHEWFRSHVISLSRTYTEHIPDELLWLAKGPNDMTIRYSTYLINGFRFHTKDRELNRKTQNSGVVVLATTSSFASARDENPILGDVNYYGILTDIFELDYRGHFRVVLFKCDWADVSRRSGVKEDDFGFTLVNFKRLSNTGKKILDEPFVLASQAKQVFYVQDPIEKDWHVVLLHKPRDLYDMNEDESLSEIENNPDVDLLSNHTEHLVDTIINSEIDNEISWVRTDIPGITIDTPLPISKEARVENEYDSDFHELD